jgi:hypothetical protein
MKKLSPEFWPRLGHAASILTALVAILALWDTARTTREGSRTESLAIATSMLQDYMRLALEHPDLANRSDALPVDAKYEWLAAHAFVAAEGIYRLTAGRPAWDSAVSAIVQYHRTYVRDGKFACADYEPEFTLFVEARLQPSFKCMRP